MVVSDAQKREGGTSHEKATGGMECQGLRYGLLSGGAGTVHATGSVPPWSLVVRVSYLVSSQIVIKGLCSWQTAFLILTLDLRHPAIRSEDQIPVVSRSLGRALDGRSTRNTDQEPFSSQQNGPSTVLCK